MSSKNCRQFIYLVILFGVVVEFSSGQLQNDQTTVNRQRGSETVRRTMGLDPVIHRAYVNAYVNVNQSVSTPSTQPTPTTTSNPWELLAPRLPSPSEIDCYVEVVTISRRGGRCTRLGGIRFHTPFICQRGPHFDFYPACEGIMAARNNGNHVNQTTRQQQQVQP